MRQEWLVGGIFGLGTVVGGFLTCHVLRNQPNPAALDEETQFKLNALPFRTAIPAFLPQGAEAPLVEVEADEAGSVRALLVYRTPHGCFGLRESPRGLPPVSGVDAGLVTNRLLGTGLLFTDPEVSSSVLGSTLRVALVGPSKLGDVGCAQQLTPADATAVLQSLCLVAPPPPPLPSLQ